MRARLWHREPSPPATANPSWAGPATEFLAYADDSIISARIHFRGDRLADLLNASPVLELEEVRLTSLHDGHAVELRTWRLERDDLLAIQALGPRGNAQRRRRTRLHPVEIGLGPYQVRGGLHALPGVDPFHGMPSAELLALTEAQLAYRTGEGVWRTVEAAALLVNRRRVEWVAPTRDEIAQFPELAYALDSTSLAKDFTGELTEP